MFSALKKLVTNEQGDTRPNMPSGMQAMGVSLQRRFAKGVQYNMKVIIKGDRNTGKSTLFHRLQGEKFKEEYLSTAEIQVASIQWNYKATDDVVKVEVWDVVDKGKPRKRDRNTLKIDNKEPEAEEPDSPCLDASFLDVYKGTNGVVMMLDISKQWTWKYVQNELPKVPNHIPILVMANFRDMYENQAVYREEIEYFIHDLDRPPGCAHIRVAEASMKNGFGLQYLHSFFNIPFLQLQRETLIQQLQRNELETDATLEELDARIESEDQDYDMYLTSLSQKVVGKGSKGASLHVPNGQAPRRASDTSSNPSSASATPARVSPAHTPNQLTPSSTPPSRHRSPPPPLQTQQQTHQQQQQQQQALPPKPPAASAAPAAQGQEEESLGNRFSKWFAPSESKVKQGTRVEDEKPAVIESPAEIHHTHSPSATPTPATGAIDVDDFVPDVGLDKGFFDETDSKAAAATTTKKSSIFSFGRKSKPKPKPTPPPQPVAPVPPPDDDSDSDDGANPMVAGFQEELDSEDEVPGGGAADLASPSTEGPDTPQDSPIDSPAEPPRWARDDSSSDGDDDRPVVAVDEDVDSDMDVPAPTKSKSKSASQNSGWSMEIAQQSSAHSKPNAPATSSQNSSASATKPSPTSASASHNTGWSLDITHPSSAQSQPNNSTSFPQNSTSTPNDESVNSAAFSRSSSVESDSHKNKSSVSRATTKPHTIPPERYVEESSSEEEQVHVLQDVEDISDDEQLAVKPAAPASRGEDVRRSGTSSRVPGIKEEQEEEEESGEETQAVQQVTTQEVASPTTLGLTLQLDDLDFLESVTSKPAKNTISRNLSRASDEFDVLVAVDEDLSEAETNTSTSTSSSAKKKKHRTKDKEHEEEKSHKKHKHKKHRDRDGEEKRPSRKDSSHEGGGTDEKKKKKKKSSSSSSTGGGSSSTKKKSSSSGERREKKKQSEAPSEGASQGGAVLDDNAALEAFLEGF